MIDTLLLAAMIGATQAVAQPRTEPDPIAGKTLRWIWKTGPTANSTHEHTFHQDGSMDWRILDGRAKGKTGHEKKYAVLKAGEDVYTVSYLSESGYTVTVSLNFRNHRMVGFASNSTEWYPVDGVFEVVDRKASE